MKKIICAFSVLFALTVHWQCSTPEELMLASEGKAHYAVVVAADASPAERFAAGELADYLEKITGTAFTVSEKPDGPSLFVQLASGEATAKEVASASGSESWSIRTKGRDIYLTGNDARGVTYAVYGFLHKLGCRWIAPEYDFFEGYSHYIPSRPELTYRHTGDIADTPELKYRKFYVEEGKSHHAANLLQLIDWMPKLGYNTLVIPIDYQKTGRVRWDNWRLALTPELQKRGIIIEVGGHGYENFLNASMEGGKLFGLHPEWFGMDENGKRSPDKHTVFCTSNPEAVRYLQNNVISYLESHPEIQVFDFWPPDMERWCTCPVCSTTSPEQRHFELVNRMSRMLKDTLPGITLECLAYSRYVTPPEGVTLDPDVLLDFCPVTQNYEVPFSDRTDPGNARYDQSLLKWRAAFGGDLSIYSYYRKYKWRSLPNVFPHYMQNDLKYFRSVGTNGISIYSEPGDWFAYGPNYYVLGHLAQHPDANVDELMREYTSLLFGPAAEVMDGVYRVLEEVVRAGCYFPDSTPKPAEQYDGYYEQAQQASENVRKARQQSGTDNPILDGHLQRVELMLDYVLRSIRQQQEMVRLGQRGDYRLTEELKTFFRENKGRGIFVI